MYNNIKLVTRSISGQTVLAKMKPNDWIDQILDDQPLGQVLQAFVDLLQDKGKNALTIKTKDGQTHILYLCPRLLTEQELTEIEHEIIKDGPQYRSYHYLDHFDRHQIIFDKHNHCIYYGLVKNGSINNRYCRDFTDEVTNCLGSFMVEHPDLSVIGLGNKKHQIQYQLLHLRNENDLEKVKQMIK